MSLRFRSSASARALMTALALIVVGGPAAGQMTWEEILRRTMSQADFDECARVLSFDDPGREAVFRSLYGDLCAEFAKIETQASAKLEEINRADARWHAEHPNEGDPWGSHGLDFGFTDLNFRVLEERGRLERQFENDVAASLDERQRAVWIDTTQALRRRQQLLPLRQHWSQRESYDLVALVGALTLDPNEHAQVDPLIDAYQAQMDERLRRLQSESPMLNHMRMSSAARAAKAEARDVQEERKRSMEAGNTLLSMVTAIIETNTSFAPQVANALGPANRTALLAAIDAYVYPELFRRDPVETVAELLRAADGVLADKITTIDAILAVYLPARDQLRRTILDQVRQTANPQSRFSRGVHELWQRAERGELSTDERNDLLREIKNTHPANPHLRQRHELTLDACRRIRALFTDDVFARLPPAARLSLSWCE